MVIINGIDDYDGIIWLFLVIMIPMVIMMMVIM